MRVRRWAGTVAATLLAVGVAAGCTPDGDAPPAPKVTSSTPIRVTLAVYGPDSVISAYTTIAARFQSANPGITVNIEPYATHAAAMAALQKTEGTAAAPDIFLANRDDLTALMADHVNQRVDEMLTDRNVDFGDSYERQALEAFSADSALQCMPVSVSPLVVYYNRTLIDLSTLRVDSSTQPDPESGWSFADFVAAAKQASAAPGHRGVYIDPTIAQVAPFVFSGGGHVVDDASDPTALTLSGGASADAMRQVLALTRDHSLTFTARQLQRQDALSRFKTGQLGMILGYRSLTPTLRQQDGLTFGVMPLPRVRSSATVTDAEGFCVRKDLAHRTSTAALLAYLVSDSASRTLSRTGYVVPANVNAMNSDAFVQPTEQPLGAEVFGAQLRYARSLPSSAAWQQAQPSLDAGLNTLFNDANARLKPLDATISALLAPPPTESPSQSPSESPGQSPGQTPTRSPSASPSD